MPDLSTFAVVAIASFALAIVPGPAVLYIVTRSVSQGRTAGIVSVAGIHTGTLVHVAAAVAGLSTLLMRSALAFNIVKYAGAAYLVYLGIRKLRETDSDMDSVVVREESLRAVFQQAAIVNVLNPKTALFFFAFLPQFVDPAQGAIGAQMFALGLVFIVVASASDILYALITSGLGDRLRASSAFARRQRLFAGSVYLALGVTAAFSGNLSSS